MNDTHRPPNGDDREGGPDSTGAGHSSHDLYLVAALAANDLAGSELVAAERLVERCSECRLLLDDLRAIAQATAALPDVPRPRDFRLTVEDAARLRPGGWRRFIAAFSDVRVAVPRSVAIGLTTVGIAGLIVSAIPAGGLGGLGSSAAAPLAASGQDSSGSNPNSSETDLRPAPGATGRVAAPGAGAQGPAVPSAAASAAPASAFAVSDSPPSAPSAAPSAVGGGTAYGPLPSASNSATKNNVSPGPPGSETAVGAGSPSSTGHSAPPPALGAGVPGSPEAAGSGGSNGGPSPLLIGSALCLLVGVGLLVGRSVAGRSSRV